MLEQTQETG